jgi:hypothetical protein
MEEELYERACKFFFGMEISPRLSQYIQGLDQSIQFDPKDGDPFYLQIRQGKVAVGREKKYPPNIEDGLYISGDRESIDTLLSGEMTLAEAIYHHRIQIPGYREKEPLMVQFSRLLRRGIEAYGLDHL